MKLCEHCIRAIQSPRTAERRRACYDGGRSRGRGRKMRVVRRVRRPLRMRITRKMPPQGGFSCA